MTAYVVSASAFEMALLPSSYECRIAQVLASGTTFESNSPSFGQLAVVTYSGGVTGSSTTVTPTPMRQGAPAASATAKYTTTTALTGVGTGANMFFEAGSGAGSTVFDGTTTFYNNSFVITFQPTFDLIVSPGAALWVQSEFQDVSGTPTTFIFFEELRLSWPY